MNIVWEMLMGPSEIDPTRTNGEVIAERVIANPRMSKKYKELARQMAEEARRHRLAQEVLKQADAALKEYDDVSRR